MLRAKKLVALLVVSVAALAMSSTAAAQHQAGDSLVNVQIGDITALVPIGVAANLCDINANVLAVQAREGGAECTATATSTATPGPGNKNDNGGHQAGNSLVNVQIGDVTLMLPIAIAANVCDVNVNILALQLRQGGATCTADADAEAG